MTTLRVARLRNRYRLGAGDVDGRLRLDRVVSRALGDGAAGGEAELDAALHRAGVGGDEEVCVRRVAVTARLGAGLSEAELATAWSLAVASAIGAALREGREVVRYGTRHGAMREVVRRAPIGDFTRAWAWRRLALWTAGDAPDPARASAEVVAMLAREPAAATATLAEAAAAGTLATLVTQAPVAPWESLAAAVVSHAGASARLTTATDDQELPDAYVDAVVARVADTPLFRALAAAMVTDEKPGASSRLTIALATLAVMHAEPSLARVASAAAVRYIRALASRLVDSTPSARRATSTNARASAAPPRTTPARARTESHATRGAVTPTPAREDADAVHPADERARGRTSAAGVLFLLHVVRALDLPAIVYACDALAGRPLRWVLHRLAVTLSGLRDDDPAALAFAGLAPDAPAPDGEPHADAERDAIDALGRRLVATLGTLVPPGHGLDDAELLARVCRRRGEVVADPAWIEALLPLDEVDLLVRRAGLDVDPGWCPWIGAVVRVRYV